MTARGRLALMRGKRTLGRTTLPVIRAGQLEGGHLRLKSKLAAIDHRGRGRGLAVALGHHAHHGALDSPEALA